MRRDRLDVLVLLSSEAPVLPLPADRGWEAAFLGLGGRITRAVLVGSGGRRGCPLEMKDTFELTVGLYEERLW